MPKKLGKIISQFIFTTELSSNPLVSGYLFEDAESLLYYRLRVGNRNVIFTADEWRDFTWLMADLRIQGVNLTLRKEHISNASLT